MIINNDYSIDSVMDNFIPANERSWYPWVFPDKEWFKKTYRDNKKEYYRFIKKVKELCLNDLFFFCDEILRDPANPHLQIGLHDEICYLLQQIEYDIVFLLPRGHLKTTIANVDYTLWEFIRNPNQTFMNASETLPIAKLFLSEIKQNILSNERLNAFFPDLRPHSKNNSNEYEKWNETEIIISRNKIIKESSVNAMGCGQSLTGCHFDKKIYDDIMTPDNTDTPEKIKKAISWFENSLSLYKENCRIIVNGTRYADNDLYAHIEDTNTFLIYKRAIMEEGKNIWENEGIQKSIEKIKQRISPYLFSCQYYNEPIAKGNEEFLGEWITARRWNPEIIKKQLIKTESNNYSDILEIWFKSLDIYIGCEPARSEQKGSCYTVYFVAGTDIYGNMFGLDFIRKQLRTDLAIEEFIKIFKKWMSYNLINAKMETYGGDKHLYNIIKKEMKDEKLPAHKLKEYDKNMRTHKNDRIRQLQMPMKNGFIWLGSSTEWNEVEQELLRFPFGSSNDIIDVMAYMWLQQIHKKNEYKSPESYGAFTDRLIGNYKPYKQPLGSWMAYD